jgi:hypothetical protein
VDSVLASGPKVCGFNWQRRRALVNTVMNCLVPQKAGNLLPDLTTNFSRSNLFHGAT